MRRIAVLAMLSAFLASCTAVTESDMQAGMPAYNSSSALSGEDQAAIEAAAEVGAPVVGDAGAAAQAGALPGQTAAVPSGSPAAAGQTASGATTAAGAETAVAPTAEERSAAALQAFAAQAAPPPRAAPKAMTSSRRDGGAPVVARPSAPKAPAPEALADPAAAKPSAEATSKSAAAETAEPAQTAQGDSEPAVDPATAGDGSVATAAPVAAVSQPPKRQGFMASFFGAGGGSATSDRDRSSLAKARPAASAAKAAPKTESEGDVRMASIDLDAVQPQKRASFQGGDSLPGVRQSALFEIKRRSGLDDDADVDIYEEADGDGPLQMASAAGMARLAPNGLLKQTESVDVACLKPSLVRVLKAMERHYGNKMVVTSGYRSPSHNRRARGAKNSLHMYCAAADVQIPGVGKWELASYARSMAGRGGVGTYCHTNSVHVDVGPERDWNWRCRGRRRR